MWYRILSLCSFILMVFLTACNSQSQRNLPLLGSCDQLRTTRQAPEEFLKLTNPLKFNSETIGAGKALYQNDTKPVTCAKCHGEDGDGFGPMANMFNPSPRNFTCVENMNNLQDGQIFWVIKNGSPETSMPAFDKLSDDEIWQLVAYIRDLSH